MCKQEGIYVVCCDFDDDVVFHKSTRYTPNKWRTSELQEEGAAVLATKVRKPNPTELRGN